MNISKQMILLVEDNVPVARTYESYLAQQHYGIISAQSIIEAQTLLEEREFDVLLLDINLPDGNGLELLKIVQDNYPSCAVIMITADGSVNQAVEAMQMGAKDYLLKPFSADRLRVTISNALERRSMAKTIEKYQSDFNRTTYCDFIGSSLAMQNIYRIVDSAASSEATIFIKGETGTGKELLASAIHQKSPRANNRFVPLNCAAIPSELMESEIFGHIKGAFTGANEERAGAAQQAHKGTLFFDEICEMDYALQAKLLRFVQTGTYQKVGSDKLEKVDIRFVCATNRNPLHEVEEGRFREDLFYRLHIVPATLPPLRERDNDVMELATFFLDHFAKEEDKNFKKFSENATKIMIEHHWPGNVRELQNAIHRIVVLNEGTAVSKEMLPNSLRQTHQSLRSAPVSHGNINSVTSKNEFTISPMREIELLHIQNALKATKNNVPKAAALLEMSPSTIYRRIKEHTDEPTD